MFDKILLPVDLQEHQLGERAAAVADDLVTRYGAHLSVITVIPSFGMPIVAEHFGADAMQRTRHEVQQELQRFIDSHFTDPAAVTALVEQGPPQHHIVSRATADATDLIIIPARARNFAKTLLGSTSTYVAAHAGCSVLVVRS